jgi:hypothetical protein
MSLLSLFVLLILLLASEIKEADIHINGGEVEDRNIYFT